MLSRTSTASPRHLCGSPQAWSPPSPGPSPSGRSRAGFQRAQHRHQSLCIRAAADPDVTPSISNSIAPALASTWPRGSRHCATADDPASTTAGINCSPSAPERPASDSLNGTDRISARHDLGYNPGLIRITPCPPPTSAGKYFQPPDRLSDSIMVIVHSKPNGPNSNRRLAGQVIIRKGAKQRLWSIGGRRTLGASRKDDR
jgi:hypothetical protein